MICVNRLLKPFSAQSVARVSAALVLCVTVCMQAIAQPLALPAYVAGEHYQVLPSPIKLAADDKIEVMEVFWYGCGGCQRFEPIVRAWKKTLSDDVSFMRTPAVWGKKGTANYKIMYPHARVYYTVNALELPDAIHDDLFAAIVTNRKLGTAADFAPIFAKYGVAEDVFTAKFNSFTVSTHTNKAVNRLTKNYNTSGTPELVVNGRYRVTSKMVDSMPGMLDVANYLIEQERTRMK